jgi:MoaA/NifB/PqqE/SkfB family radical SAM enzyme
MKGFIKKNYSEKIFEYLSLCPLFIKLPITYIIPAIMRTRLNYRQLPTSLILFVTERCNLKCQHCFIVKSPKYDAKIEKEMELRDYQKMFHKIKNKISIVKITGGEPLLRSDLAQIIIAASKGGGIKYASIFTNGTMTDNLIDVMEEVIEKSDIGLGIQVSIHGDEELNDEIRGEKGSYQATIKTMKALSEIRLKYPHRIFRLSAATGIFRENEHRIQQVVDMVNSSGFEHLVSFPRSSKIHTFNIGNEWKSSYYPINYKFWEPSDIEKKLAMVEKMLWGNKKISLFKKINKTTLESMIEMIRKEKPISPCYSGKGDLTVYSNGDISRCEMLKSVTNLAKYKYDIKLLFKSSEYKNYLNNTDKCWCLHDCSIGLSMIYDTKLFRKLFI